MVSQKIEFTGFWVGEHRLILDTSDLGRIGRHIWKAAECKGDVSIYRELSGTNGGYELLENFILHLPSSARVRQDNGPLDFRKETLRTITAD